MEAVREYNNHSNKWYKPDWDYEQTEINFNNNLSEFENDRNMLQAMVNYDNNTKDANLPRYWAFPSTAQEQLNSMNRIQQLIPLPKLPIIGEISTTRNITYVDTYNCIDWAATACRVAGGTNCNPNHAGVRPSSGNTNLDNYFLGK